jgi:hypothetical protein
MRKIFGVVIASATGLLLSSAAHAGTVVSTFVSVPGFTSSVPAKITFEEGPFGFTAADALLGYVWSGTGELRGPPTTFDSALPAGDTSNWYMSVLGGKQETLDFASAQFPNGVASVGLFIGSLDTYNNITFKSGGLSQTIDGTTLLDSVFPGNASLNSGNQSSDSTNRFFTFVFNNSTPVDQIVFDSSINSLEFDNLSATVGVGRSGGGGLPEPASWTVMIAGFGLLGSLLRRRVRAPALVLG